MFSFSTRRLLVDPCVSARHVPRQLLGLEPQCNLLLGGFNSIRSVTDVTSNLNAEVSTDGAWLGVLGVGLAKHDPAGLDNAGSLPDHWDDWSGAHVLDEAAEEWLGGEVGVVLLQQRFVSLHDFHGDELESLLLEPLDDFADQTALDTVGLDHDEGPLIGHGDVCWQARGFRKLEEGWS